MIGGEGGESVGAEIHVEIGIHEQVSGQKTVIRQRRAQIRIGRDAQNHALLLARAD